MTARLIAATLGLLAVTAAPASAQVTMQPLKPCYASAGSGDDQREGVDVSGKGFTPLAEIEVLVDGVVVSTGKADAFGQVSDVTVLAPYQPRGERPFSVTVREKYAPTVAVTQASRVTNLAVTLHPNRARPSRRVRYRGRGFMQDAPVYAHYVFGGKPRRTVRLARRPTGPCGTFSVRRRQIPIVRPRTGDWLVQIDQRRDFDEGPGTNWVQVLIRVARDFRDPDED